MWFTPRMGATSTKLCFYYIFWGKLAQFVALQMQRQVSPRSLILSLYCLSFYITSLSVLSMNDYIQTQMTHRRLCVWIVTTQSVWLIPESTKLSTDQLSTDWLSNHPTNPLQYKNASFYRQPEGRAITTLWACPNSKPHTLNSDIRSSLSLR